MNEQPAMSDQPDGVVDGAMRKVFGRNWKTTVAGVIVAVCGVVQAVPDMNQTVRMVCAIAMAVAGGSGLIAAKDHNVR